MQARQCYNNDTKRIDSGRCQKERTLMKLTKSPGQKPLWGQLYDILKERILRGEYPEGTNLPTEAELMKEFSVSRVTVRLALDHLLKDELISRRRGSGTIVLPQKRNISTSFRSTVIGEEHNFRTDRRVSSFTYAKAPENVSVFFGIDPEQEVLKLVRCSYISDRPVAKYISYYNPMVPIDDRTDVSGSVYRLLKEVGYPVDQVSERITACVLEEGDEQLDVKGPVAIIQRVRHGFSGDHPIEFSQNYYLADDYAITIKSKVSGIS